MLWLVEFAGRQLTDDALYLAIAFCRAETAETYVKETSESSKSLSHHPLVAALVVLWPVRAQKLPVCVNKSSTARLLSPQLYLIPHTVSLPHSIQPPARRSSSIAPLSPVARALAMTLQLAPLDLAALEPYDPVSSSALRWISWGSNEHAAFLGVRSTAFQPLVPPAPAKPPAAIDPKQKHAEKVLIPKSTYRGSSPSAKPSATAPYVSSVARRKQHFTHPSPSASTTSLSTVHSPITSDSLTTPSIATNASSRMPELAHVGVIDIKFLCSQKLPKEEKEKLKEKPKDVLAETPELPATPPPVQSVKRRGGAARAGPATTAGSKAAPTSKGKGKGKPSALNAQNDEDDDDKEKKEREVQLFRFLPPSQQPTSGPYIRYSPMYHPYHPFRSMHREAVKKEIEARNPPLKPEPVVEKEVEEAPAPQRRQSSRQKKQTTRLTAAEKKEKAKEAKERAKERAKEKALKAKEAAKEKTKEAANSKTEPKGTPPEREPSPPVVATRSRAAAAAAKTAAASKSKTSGNSHAAAGDSKADTKSSATKGRASRAATAGAKRKREEDEEQAIEEITPPPKRPRRGAATRSTNAQNGNGSNDAMDGDEQAQDNASQEGSSNGNLEEHSASSPTGDPPNGDKPPQRRMRPGTRKTQAARAAAMAAKVRNPCFRFCGSMRTLMGEGQKRSLAERENKSPGAESMDLDQDTIDYDVSLKVEALEEKEGIVPDAAAAPSPPPSTATPIAAVPAPTLKGRGRGGKSRGGVSRGRASAKRRTGVRSAKALQREVEEEHAEDHEAEPAEEHVEESQEVWLHTLRASRILVDFTFSSEWNWRGQRDESSSRICCCGQD